MRVRTRSIGDFVEVEEAGFAYMRFLEGFVARSLFLSLGRNQAPQTAIVFGAVERLLGALLLSASLNSAGVTR